MLIALEPADGEAILPLEKLKARVRVIAADEDEDIASMRDQAIDFVERKFGKSLSQRAFQWIDSQFCTSMRLPMGPVISVEGISYYATDGTDTALADGDWLFTGGAVVAPIGGTWPDASDVPGSVRVTFTAGFSDAETEAPLLIASVCVAVAAIYENRESPNWTPAINVASSYWTPEV